MANVEYKDGTYTIQLHETHAFTFCWGANSKPLTATLKSTAFVPMLKRLAPILGVLAMDGSGSVAWAATIPDDAAKWASKNPAVYNSVPGCSRNEGALYCATQDGVDRLVALYNASAKGQTAK